MDKRKEVEDWISKVNSKDENGYEYYFIEKDRVWYFNYDRRNGDFGTIDEFWDEYVRPRTPEELDAIERKTREAETKAKKEAAIAEVERRQRKYLERKLKNKEFRYLTNVSLSEAKYFDEIPNDGQMYYHTDKGWTLIKNGER